MGKAGAESMRLLRKGPPTRADWEARRRRAARKRAADAKPRDAKPLHYEVDVSDASKRPATAALALVVNFFVPGVGLIIYGQRKWGLTLLAATLLTFYIGWFVTMPLTTGLTANHAFRRDD